MVWVTCLSRQFAPISCSPLHSQVYSQSASSGSYLHFTPLYLLFTPGLARFSQFFPSNQWPCPISSSSTEWHLRSGCRPYLPTLPYQSSRWTASWPACSDYRSSPPRWPKSSSGLQIRAPASWASQNVKESLHRKHQGHFADPVVVATWEGCVASWSRWTCLRLEGRCEAPLSAQSGQLWLGCLIDCK